MSPTSLLSPRLLLWLALLLCLGLRLPFAGTSFFNVDEAVSAMVGQAILEGGLPYQAAVDHRGPLTYYLYAALFGLWGEVNMLAVHLAYPLLVAWMTWLVFLVGEKASDRRSGAWAALFFALFSWTNSFSDTLAAHTEWLAAAGSLGGFWAYLHARQTKQAAWYWLGGACFALGALSKQVGVFDGLGLAAFALLRLRQPGQSGRDWLVEMGQMAGAACLVLAATAAYFWQAGAWEELVAWFWVYNVDHYLPALTPGLAWFHRLYLMGNFLDKWLLVGLAALSLPFLARALRGDSRYVAPLLFTCWGLAALMGALLGGRAFAHYLIPGFAPLCLLAGWRWQQLEKNSPWPRLLPWVLALSLLAPLGHGFWRNRLFWHAPPPPLTPTQQVAPYLKAQAKPEDRLLVWGFNPGLYYLTGLKPASRFVFTNPIAGYVPASHWYDAYPEPRPAFPGSQDTLLAEVARHPPRWIVDTYAETPRLFGPVSLDDLPALKAQLLQGYVLDTIFTGKTGQVPVYRRQE